MTSAIIKGGLVLDGRVFFLFFFYQRGDWFDHRQS